MSPRELLRWSIVCRQNMSEAGLSSFWPTRRSSVTVFAMQPPPGLTVNVRTWNDDLSIVLTVRHVSSEVKWTISNA